MPVPFRIRKLMCPVVAPCDLGSSPEVAQITGVLARAFAGDRFNAITMGYDPDCAGASMSAVALSRATAIAGLLGGLVYVAETSTTGAIVGVAIWFAPGRALFDSEEQRTYGLAPVLATFDDDLNKWWDGFLPQYDNFVTATLGEGTKLASWHLQTVGVDPAWQRQGAARLLVNTVAEEIVHTGIPIVVECSEEVNIEVYERLGFHLMPRHGSSLESSKTTFTGVKGHSCDMWVLVRDY